MEVKELIEQLYEMPQNAEVLASVRDGGQITEVKDISGLGFYHPTPSVSDCAVLLS